MHILSALPSQVPAFSTWFSPQILHLLNLRSVVAVPGTVM
jgi:hypothetical protein